jgi:hypothetical protein
MPSALQLGLFSPRWSLPAPGRARPFCDPFFEASRPLLEEAGVERLTFDEETWDWDTRAVVAVDVETYRNFFAVCFLRLDTRRKMAFELSARSSFNTGKVIRVMTSNTIVTFNGTAYDLPLMRLAVRGASNQELKAVSDHIINSVDARGWMIERELGLRGAKGLDHVDLMESNPSVHQGLKMLHARLHGRYVVDLPYPPGATLTPEQMNVTTLYCFNDLDATRLVWEAMREPIALREALSTRYNVDLRNKSDAQIGETIVRIGVERTLRTRIGPVTSETTFGYEPPDFLSFYDRKLNWVLRGLKSGVFTVSESGKIVPPPILENLTVTLGEMTYSMGIGGLHSTEETRLLRSNAEYQLVDVDAASQYPNIILKLGIYPRSLGPAFLKVYGELVAERLAAKSAGQKAVADGLKIGVNGVFGKLGSRYGCLSAPKLMIAVTLTGQLSILMLIELAEVAGISVVSANTDGVLFWCPRPKLGELRSLLRSWEQLVGMVTEEALYSMICNSSVNSYIAVREDGKAKRKGPLADPWSENDFREQMKKNPQTTICSEAILRYVRDGEAIDKTIVGCKDVRMFLSVIKVTGGAVWRGHPLGRIVRYYYSTEGEQISYANANRKVAKTDGARPLLELTDELPPDLDYVRYCEETVRLANEMGVRI